MFIRYIIPVLESSSSEVGELRRSRSKEKYPGKQPRQVPNELLENYAEHDISCDCDKTLQLLQKLIGMNDDFVVRRFDVLGKFPAAIVYFSNINNQEIINTDILRPFMYGPPLLEDKHVRLHELADFLLHKTLYHTKSRTERSLVQLVEAMFRGETIVLIDGLKEAILIETRSIEKRSINNPETEQVIRGPREGFIEPLGTNISLLRYRLQTVNFRVNQLRLGRLSKSNVAVCYIEGIVNPELVEEVKRRLGAIDTEAILDAGYIEQFIEDHHISPFPQIQYTERPDKAVSSMMEGKVAIMVDGSPFALILPAVFSQFYQTTEDYSERFLMASLVRLVRLLSLLFALIFPALYVAVISFNPELIPTDFAVAVAGGRAGVPFPTVIEVLIMEIAMEVLREATLRLPTQVGGALSIVGVLVVGQAAVEAGFVSPITVVVIALTTIGSFATPAYNAAIALRMLRFPMIIAAGTFGLYGLMIGLILVINHILSLKSFGVPYLSPIVPGNFQAMKDTVIRGPLWWMPKRPSLFHTPNKDRLGQNVKDELKKDRHNTLDPLKAGNKRWKK